MADQQNWPSLSLPMQPYNQVLLVGQRSKEADVFRRKTGLTKTASHGFSRRGDVAGRRICCIDLDEFLENVMRDLVFRTEAGLLRRATRHGHEGQEKDEKKSIHRAWIINSCRGPSGILFPLTA